MTPPERLLWSRLRKDGIPGLKFRRQHPIGPYIADFYCHEARLVIEVDGPSHGGERRLDDQRRDEWMRDRGVGMLRFLSSDVMRNLSGVLTTIRRVAEESISRKDPLRHPSDDTSPAGAGEGQHMARLNQSNEQDT
jgi:very-short-patch-repair endonuclease